VVLENDEEYTNIVVVQELGHRQLKRREIFKMRLLGFGFSLLLLIGIAVGQNYTKRYHLCDLSHHEPQIIERCVDSLKVLQENTSFIVETIDDNDRTISIEIFETPHRYWDNLNYGAPIVLFNWGKDTLEVIGKFPDPDYFDQECPSRECPNRWLYIQREKRCIVMEFYNNDTYLFDSLIEKEFKITSPTLLSMQNLMGCIATK